VQKGCTSDPLQVCIDKCTDELAEEPQQCVSVQLGLSVCGLKKLGCELGSGTAILDACPNEAAAYTKCAACVPDPADDDPCDACAKQNCCAERKASFGDPNLIAFTECIGACSDAACYETCANQYPSIKSTAQALASCQATSCASACQ
jgi:hypothetical protein